LIFSLVIDVGQSTRLC